MSSADKQRLVKQCREVAEHLEKHWHGSNDEAVATLRAAADALAVSSCAATEEVRAELETFRIRAYLGQGRCDGSGDHSTACLIWGDDGQGKTKEGWTNLRCSCGALADYWQRKASAVPESEATFPKGADAQVAQATAADIDRIRAETRQAAHTNITVGSPQSAIAATVTEEMADSVRGVLQMLRGKPGATFKDVRVHCSARGDDLSLWPVWIADCDGYVTEEAAARMIYGIMAANAPRSSSAESTKWEEEARRYAQNADYWREKYESALSATGESKP